MRSIEAFTNRNVVILNESATAFSAAKAMCANGIGSVIVTDGNGHISGLVTDRDLACRVLAKSLGPVALLREVMTPDIAYVSENASIEDAIATMERRGVRRIPVLRELRGDRQRCVGLITLDDLIAADEISPPSLRKVVQSQTLRRLRHGGYVMDGTSGRGSEGFVTRLSSLLETNEKKAKSFARFLFSMISQRLTYSAAVQFILQLPFEFHAKLLQLMPGPDRMIAAQEIVQGTSTRLGVTAESSRHALQKAWGLLNQYSEKDQLRHTLAQPPVAPPEI